MPRGTPTAKWPPELWSAQQQDNAETDEVCENNNSCKSKPARDLQREHAPEDPTTKPRWKKPAVAEAASSNNASRLCSNLGARWSRSRGGACHRDSCKSATTRELQEAHAPQELRAKLQRLVLSRS